jgi:hypothetical protein
MKQKGGSIFFSSFIVMLGGIQCGIYKGSYHVSNTYLNSSSPWFSFIPLFPDSWNSINKYHFYSWFLNDRNKIDKRIS